MPTHPLLHLLTFRDKGLEVVEVRISSKSSTVGKQVKELALPSGSILSLIIRKDQKPLVPAPETVLEAEDQIIALTTTEAEETLRTALRGD